MNIFSAIIFVRSQNNIEHIPDWIGFAFIGFCVTASIFTIYISKK